MRHTLTALSVLAVATLFAIVMPEADTASSHGGTGSSAAQTVAPKKYYGRIGLKMARMLPNYHVLQQPLDDEISRRAWTNLVTYYDYDHSVFLQSDLDNLSQHEKTIDDELLSGDIWFGFEIYDLYCKRLKERVEFATNLLASAASDENFWDFSQNEMYRVKRKDAPWPATREEAEEHWRKRMKNEVLVQLIARELDAEENKEKPSSSPAATEGAISLEATVEDEAAEDAMIDDDKNLTPEENLIKKYRQYATVLTEPDEEAVLQHYLSAVARAYDPHSDYMSPASKEDFDMDMSLTLCGVGAVLSMDDGALKIAEIMPGGPMDLDGRIKTGDKITGVKQGDGVMEDIMWQPIKKSIRKIRGEKGTRVTLEIMPRSDPSGTTRKYIELVRDEIKLEDQAATGRVEKVVFDGIPRKLGYVYLPGFYGTMDKAPGDEGYRSASEDVAKYLGEFNAQDVEGLVLDLRGDGGGSLKEAVLLSALFVPSGPVVQIRDTRTVSPLPIPRGLPVAFKKPMVVLVDRASASASEIVAGHLRDTGRAIILGDAQTHGKGTVQTVYGMGAEKYGSMKITTARFYRVNGMSTQMKGVAADIRLPSLLDSLDIGEDKLTYALPFTYIRKADYAACWDLDKHIPELKRLSEERLKNNERYIKHIENVAAMKELADREVVPLEKSARTAMMRSDREIRELDEDKDDDKNKDKEKGARRKRNQLKSDDVVLDEAFAILSDLIRFEGGATLPDAGGPAGFYGNMFWGF